MVGKIFISYRRSETAWAARALFERLWREFGDRVFIDIEGLRLGIDYTKVIDEHLEGCEVMLALIGPTWLDEIRRRLDDEDEPDWVRSELARALGRGIPVVPVQIDGAVLPKRAELPDDLKDLRKRNGMTLHAEHFDDRVARLVRELRNMLSGTAEPVSVPAVVATPPVVGPTIMRSLSALIHDHGTDEYGRWCEFKVGNVVQRMRWIEPGTFWMGSPPDEAERHHSELRHRVVLTKGYWLADTACTQALWEEVVGANPSKFQGDLQLPVEQVSWNDITTVFLPRLNARVPGLNLELPTEAQWEYACRAGMTTPFSLGEQITPEQVNYDGNHPYNDGKTGRYREKTVPVKALPANDWGLYQMHGNVFEWCADGFRNYLPEEAKDPVFFQRQSIRRVLRGGGWLSSGGVCRSAHRAGYESVARGGAIGFRLAGDLRLSV